MRKERVLLTQLVPWNISRSSGSPWIFPSRSSREWQVAMALHRGPQGRGEPEEKAWTFWKLAQRGNISLWSDIRGSGGPPGPAQPQVKVYKGLRDAVVHPSNLIPCTSSVAAKCDHQDATQTVPPPRQNWGRPREHGDGSPSGSRLQATR